MVNCKKCVKKFKSDPSCSTNSNDQSVCSDCLKKKKLVDNFLIFFKSHLTKKSKKNIDNSPNQIPAEPINSPSCSFATHSAEPSPLSITSSEELSRDSIESSPNLLEPKVIIFEEPESKARFRFLAESKSAEFIKGVNSTQNVLTYTAIKILNYIGPVNIIVSCVTADEPYRYLQFENNC